LNPQRGFPGRAEEEMMIHLTESAVTEIKRLMAERNHAASVVRFGVEEGGCSGLQYSMDFDLDAAEGDEVFEQGGLKVVCSAESRRFLEGLEVDFSAKLMGGGFKFHNPNATRSCGCGTSFRI
jgi:iron-sulfur cluster assembly accessory protein